MGNLPWPNLLDSPWGPRPQDPKKIILKLIFEVEKLELIVNVCGKIKCLDNIILGKKYLAFVEFT